MGLNKNSKIFLAGHKGLVGSSILRYLKKKNYKKIFTIDKKKLDLTDQLKTEKYLRNINPDFVIITAAKVGGIYANQNFKAEFIYNNIMIQTNLIHASYKTGVKKLIFLGSSCIYPKYCKQPIKEKYLLSGKLEPTNDAYAIAKIAGLKMCEAYNQQYKLNYICLMPTNLYGPNDNYNLKSSHFFPALISKIYNAKIKSKKLIKIWGNGLAKRELLYVDDLSEACEFFLKKKTKHTLINIGSGYENTITGYAKFISKKLDVKLNFIYDYKKPNGTPRKKLNLNLAKSYGWESKTSLSKGFDLSFEDFKKKYKNI
jgi:GDP-L-fucose synthase